MSDMKLSMARKFATQLKNMGFDFAIYDGENLIAQNGEFRRCKAVKRGEMSTYALPFIKDMSVGDTVKIPFGDYEPDRLAPAVSGAAGRWFGPGNYASRRNDEEQCVEVLYMGGGEMPTDAQREMFEGET